MTKEETINLIKQKLNKETYLSYKEIALISNYHPKYISKLKHEILDGTVKTIHGNKGKTPINIITEEEKKYIIKLYKRSHVSIRQFVRFYGKRSYSCIYNLLKNEGLI